MYMPRDIPFQAAAMGFSTQSLGKKDFTSISADLALGVHWAIAAASRRSAAESAAASLRTMEEFP
jgi:hypothetical protein